MGTGGGNRESFVKFIPSITKWHLDGVWSFISKIKNLSSEGPNLSCFLMWGASCRGLSQKLQVLSWLLRQLCSLTQRDCPHRSGDARHRPDDGRWHG